MPAKDLLTALEVEKAKPGLKPCKFLARTAIRPKPGRTQFPPQMITACPMVQAFIWSSPRRAVNGGIFDIALVESPKKSRWALFPMSRWQRREIAVTRLAGT
jgi:hypothetical protein